MSDISSVVPGGPGIPVNGVHGHSSNGHASPGSMNRVFGVNGVSKPGLNARVVEVSPPLPNGSLQADRVELSDVARWLDGLRQLPEVRHDRVTQVRQQIADGTYDTDERLDRALERFLDDELI